MEINENLRVSINKVFSVKARLIIDGVMPEESQVRER